MCGRYTQTRPARDVAEGAFAFAGQRCTATRRAIVLADFHDRFVAAIKTFAALRPQA